MARKRYTAEQIIGYLRQAEVMIGVGKSMVEVLREPVVNWGDSSSKVILP